MTLETLQRQETLLIEVLLSSLDARETARTTGSPMLPYLADLLAQQTHRELEVVRGRMLTLGQVAVNSRAADV